MILRAVGGSFKPEKTTIMYNFQTDLSSNDVVSRAWGWEAEKGL